MAADTCHVCDGELKRDGFDNSGYWRVFVCDECGTELHRPAASDMDGVSPADLSNLSDFNAS